MLEVQVIGLDALRARLDKLQDALDPEDILDEAEALLLNRIRQRFMDQVDPDGNKWQPLNPKYAKKKMARWGGGGILFASGAMFHSIQAFVSGPNERSIATDDPKARFHQFGTVRMPRRMFLGFSDEDLYLTERRVLQRVMEALA